jgi:hypothetical protein
MKQREYEIKKEQINALHKIETWGLSLFVAGIALLTKQLFDWHISKTPFPSFSIFTPILFGMYGSTIVFFANAKNRKLRREIIESTGQKEDKLKCLGGLCFMLAAMPLFFGIVCYLFLFEF